MRKALPERARLFRLSKKAQTAKKGKATIANSVGVTAKAKSIKSGLYNRNPLINQGISCFSPSDSLAYLCTPTIA